MRKWKLLPSIPACGLYFPPQKASEIPMGRGLIQEKAISKEMGSDSQGLFSRDFETRIIVFIDDLTFITV